MYQLVLLKKWQFAACAAAPVVIMVLWRKWPIPALIKRLMYDEHAHQKRLILAMLAELEAKENSKKDEEKEEELQMNEPLKMPESFGNIKNNRVKQEVLKALDRICIKRFGVLTNITDTTCTFDFKYEFDRQFTQHLFMDSIKKGSVIEYLAYKATVDANERIFKLLKFEEETWETDCTDNELSEQIKKYATEDVEIIDVHEDMLTAKVVNVGADKSLTFITNNQQMHIEGELMQKIMILPYVGDFINLRLIYYKKPQILQHHLDRGDLLDVLEINAIDEATYNLKNEAKITSQSKNWVEIKCKPTLNYIYKKETCHHEITIINNRKNVLKLLALDILAKDTGERVSHIYLANANIFENGGFHIHGNALDTIYLVAKRSGATARARILLKFHFEKFILDRHMQEVFDKEDASAKLYEPIKIERDQLYAYSVMENAKRSQALPAPSSISARRFKGYNIDIYEIPLKLSRAFFASGNFGRFNIWLQETYHSILDAELNMTNYRQRFELLLHLEELFIFDSFRKFDLKDARFYKDGEFLCLELENLQERRPSLMVGDSVRVKNVLQYSDVLMDVDGSIQKVLQNRIFIKFHEQFTNNYNNEVYTIIFNYSRYCLRKMHHSIKIMSNRANSNILFPDFMELRYEPQIQKIRLVGTKEDDLRLKVNDKYSTWYNDKLNLLQKRAVCNILNGVSKLPYCIFGPPGTGKTVTVVETILQLLHHLPESRLLIATPSNSAADLIAMRLLKYMSHLQLLRIVAHSAVEKDLIPAELLKYCATVDIGIDEVTQSEMSMTSDGVILRVPKKFLCNYRILIGTCSTLGTLMQIKFAKDHFTHAIVDEAAQCLEPEVMCVLSLLGPKGQVILCGDPKQLPPTVMSSAATAHGLGYSYMERILDCSPYAKDESRYQHTNGYDGRTVTMLIFNYRSLPSILCVYNWLFYHGYLRPILKSDTEPEYSFLKHGLQSITEVGEGVQNRILDSKHATYFCSISGINQQDEDSPSWFNILEAQEVFKIVMALFARKVSADDIGIITPYIKQARLIRSLFTGIDNAIPKVGTVEEFQGQERKIILISTVRTSNELLPEDKRHRLGFLTDEKRINVALSRARALLIVIGNAELLSHDSHWITYMIYCHQMKAYFGDENGVKSYLNIMKRELQICKDKKKEQLTPPDPNLNPSGSDTD